MARADREPIWTDWDAEGATPVEDLPPGIDAESAVEGAFPPRDQPLGSEEWGTTAREQLVGEPLAERVKREEPDIVP
jgi:hypothetical protein